MFVCRSRPGSRFIHGARPLNMSSDKRVRNRISPIHTKSGSAVSVQDDVVPQIVSAIASPAERGEKSSIAIQATPARARPIHTPTPSSTKSAMMRRVVISTDIAGSPLFGVRELGGRAVIRLPASPHEHEFVDNSDREDGRPE